MTADFKLFGGSIHSALVHAATQYDARMARNPRRQQSHYALAQYLMRIEEVEADIEAGAAPRDALIAAFSGSLLDTLLKAIGEPRHQRDETAGRLFYKPAVRS